MLLSEQYNMLWSTSWITLYPTLMALHRKQYDMALGTGMVFLTSLNYWKDPTNQMNRLIDVTTVRCVLLYQLYSSIVKKKRLFWIFASTGVTSYLVGCHFYRQDKLWLYTYCHFGLHILGNCGNFTLLE
jgi:hypothetical protein